MTQTDQLIPSVLIALAGLVGNFFLIRQTTRIRGAEETNAATAAANVAAAAAPATARNAGVGTGNPRYAPTTEYCKRSQKSLTKHSICHMPAYANKSAIELRWEDYKAAAPAAEADAVGQADASSKTKETKAADPEERKAAPRKAKRKAAPRTTRKREGERDSLEENVNGGWESDDPEERKAAPGADEEKAADPEERERASAAEAAEAAAAEAAAAAAAARKAKRKAAPRTTRKREESDDWVEIPGKTGFWKYVDGPQRPGGEFYMDLSSGITYVKATERQEKKIRKRKAAREAARARAAATQEARSLRANKVLDELKARGKAAELLRQGQRGFVKQETTRLDNP